MIPRLFRKISAITTQKRKWSRNLSNNGAHSHHGDTGPYAVKHNHPYPDEAYMFGRKPGTPLEGWEYITFGTYIVAFLICVVGANIRDDETLKDWARREYLAREKFIENGGEIKFGTWYSSKIKFREGEEIDQIPELVPIEEQIEDS